MRRLLLLPLLPLSVACSPGFTPFREVEKSRVIGATIAVDADPAISTPAPGEAATMTLVVADPGPKQGRTYAMVVCRPGTSQLDIVFCDDPALWVATNSVTTLPPAGGPYPDPSIAFTVPDAATLGDATELWVQGAVCNGGTVRDLLTDPPVYGQPWEPCMPDPLADPQPVGQVITTRIKLNVDANSLNHRPDIVTLTIDGNPWTSTAADDAPVTGCAGMGYLEVVDDGTPHPIEATTSPSSRETYVPEGLTTSYPEDIFLWVFRTAGGTDISFGTIDDSSPTARIAYEPPAPSTIDPTGTLVRFWLQLEDDRSASTYVQRALCLLPPP